MKKTIACLIVVILLAACQPAATATPVPTAEPAPTAIPTTIPSPTPPALVEVKATNKSQVYGVWYFYPLDAYFEIRGNNHAYVYKGLSVLMIDNIYSFADQMWTFDKDENCDFTATYEMYLLKKNGKVVGLRPQLIGEDKCSDRRNFLDGITFQCVTNAATSCNAP